MADLSPVVAAAPAREFLDARAEFPAPQTVPAGYLGFTDWDVVAPEEAAARGLVLVEPGMTPAIDDKYERLAWTVTRDGDGVASAEARAVPGNPDTARQAASDAIQARRDLEAVRGVQLTIGGGTYLFHTDREARADYTGTIKLAEEFEAANGAGTFSTGWRAKGAYVKIPLTLADLKAIGMAAGLHVAKVFTRAGEIEVGVLRKQRADTVHAALVAEIDAGWPA